MKMEWSFYVWKSFYGDNFTFQDNWYKNSTKHKKSNLTVSGPEWLWMDNLIPWVQFEHFYLILTHFDVDRIN